MPLGFSENTYLSYRVSTDGQSAESLSCDSLDSRTCQATDGGIVYQVQGADLIGRRTLGAEVVGSLCRLAIDETWVVSDFGATTTVGISSAFRLVQPDGGTATCGGLEQSLRANAPNGKGAVGCVLVYTLQGSFTQPQR